MDKRIIRFVNIVFGLVIVLAVFGVFYFVRDKGVEVVDDGQHTVDESTFAENTRHNRIHFAQYNPVFRFSAELPLDFGVEYIPEIESLNVYDPRAVGSTREKSQIFIRYFKASSFLTLQTVDIINREQTVINGHQGVNYEIEKKPGVSDFPQQPLWRNGRHKLTDIRFSEVNPTTFYVFAYNPEFSERDFKQFIKSIIFDNDKEAWRAPISRPGERVTKKPFGIYVTLENSPVSPERFTGFHTAVDFEILPGEEDENVVAMSVCDGKILKVSTANGYGGYLVQSCEFDSESVTVIYGHVNIGSVKKGIGEFVEAGESLAVLGTGFSSETDGERKHLHLGVHRGTKIDIRGYVQSGSELSDWIDFRKIVSF